MKPSPHKGPGAIGAPPLHPMEAVNPLKPEQTLRFSRELSLTSGDAVLAMMAFSANQALASQVTVAHLVAKLAHAQSDKLAETSRAALPAGPVRDALDTAARLHALNADSLVELANSWGRSFGRMAFAFPVPDHRTVN
jgi:hypothetical protein